MAYASYSEMKRAERAKNTSKAKTDYDNPNMVYQYDSRTGDVKMSSSTYTPPKTNPSTGNYSSSGSSGGGSSGNYDSYISLLERMLASRENRASSSLRAAEEAARRQEEIRRNALGQARDATISALESDASKALAQRAAAQERARFLMPQQAALLGLGGLSESRLIDMEARYGNDRNNIIDALNRQKQEAHNAYQQGIANAAYDTQSALNAAQLAYQQQLGSLDDAYWNAALAYRQQQDALARQQQAQRAQATQSYRNNPAFVQYVGEVASGNTAILNNPSRLAQVFGDDWLTVFDYLRKIAPSQNQTFAEPSGEGLLAY